MKKILKACLCLMMILCVAGCSGSASTEKQETVVKQFFDYFKSGDMDKLSSVCTKDNTDITQLTGSLASLDAYRDVNTFGQKFVDEANSFVSEVFSSVIISYEIKDAKKDDDKYKVTVDAKMKDYNNFNISNSEMNPILEKYQKEHLAELQKIYKEKGQKAMTEKIYGDVAEQLFGLLKDKIKETPEVENKIVFTLVADGDQWLISEMKEYKK